MFTLIIENLVDHLDKCRYAAGKANAKMWYHRAQGMWDYFTELCNVKGVEASQITDIYELWYNEVKPEMLAIIEECDI